MLEEKCWEEGNERRCIWLDKYIDEDEAYLEVGESRSYIVFAPHPDEEDEGKEAEFEFYGEELHVLKLTKDRHLLFYIRRNTPFKPKERIWHYVVAEESVELLREKMKAVKTIDEFWALIRELEEAAKRYDEFWGQVLDEAKKRGTLGLSDLEKIAKEMKEKTGYCRGGVICFEDDARRIYFFDIEDEYLYPPEPD
jgi:hypothetical protein